MTFAIWEGHEKLLTEDAVVTELLQLRVNSYQKVFSVETALYEVFLHCFIRDLCFANLFDCCMKS